MDGLLDSPVLFKLSYEQVDLKPKVKWREENTIHLNY